MEVNFRVGILVFGRALSFLNIFMRLGGILYAVIFVKVGCILRCFLWGIV